VRPYELSDVIERAGKYAVDVERSRDIAGPSAREHQIVACAWRVGHREACASVVPSLEELIPKREGDNGGASARAEHAHQDAEVVLGARGRPAQGCLVSGAPRASRADSP
jgi:hypothetical protein